MTAVRLGARPRRLLAVGVLAGLVWLLGGCESGDSKPVGEGAVPYRDLKSILPAPTPEVSPNSAQLMAPPTPQGGYNVQAGDTLYSISRKHYGQERYWKLIYEANAHQMKHPNDLRAGMRLVIPAKPSGQ